MHFISLNLEKFITKYARTQMDMTNITAVQRDAASKTKNKFDRWDRRGPGSC